MNKMRVDLNDLLPRKLMIATPMYGGQCSGYYEHATTALQDVMTRFGLPLWREKELSESLIPRARNNLADKFMRSPCTHLLFWDADIEATADDVIGLLNAADPQSNKDVICGLYPKKNIRWDKIAAAARAGVPDHLLAACGSDFVFNPIEVRGERDIYDPLEVREAGTGFMMIQRRVFDRFKKGYPTKAYLADNGSGNEMTCYFDGEIDPATKRYLSEDYSFCRLIRGIGLRVWVAPWLKLNHIGTYKFIGDPAAASSFEKTQSTIAA